jgi:hypothetical protein
MGIKVGRLVESKLRDNVYYVNLQMRDVRRPDRFVGTGFSCQPRKLTLPTAAS